MTKKKIILLLIVIIVGVICFLMNNSTYVARIEGKKVSSYKQEIEYGQDYSFLPNDISLQVTYKDQDITDLLEYEDITISSLGTYEIVYSYQDYSFTYEITVKDSSGPTITLDDQYEVLLYSTFDVNSLGIDVIDNYFIDDIELDVDGQVDTSLVGEYSVDIIASDGNDNQTTAKTTIVVLAPVNELVEGTNIVANPSDITVYISKEYALPEGWEPDDLVSIGGNHYLRQEAASAYFEMMAQAQLDGIDITLVSSYRSEAYQTNLYNSYYATDPENAPYYSAYPRSSEHELGLAIDVSDKYSLYNTLDETIVGIWMQNYAYQYGWIMSYPEDKTDITGYIYEPWHYRYVGEELATILYENNLTLGEYYDY